MARSEIEEPEITVMSEKGQVVIPSLVRNKLGLKPRTKLLVFTVRDTVLLRRLEMPDLRREWEEIWKEVDKKIAKYGELNERQIQEEIEKQRLKRRFKSKGA